MVGSGGKGSRARSKSKGVVVPVDPKPLNACPPNDGAEDNGTSKSKGAVVSADPEPLNACPPNDGEKDNEISRRAGISMGHKGKEELITDSGADAEGLTVDHEAFLDAVMDNVKVCDGVDASINMDAEITNKIMTAEQPEGENLVGSGINNEMRNGEESEEEDLVHAGINNGVRNEEERKEEDVVDSGNSNTITNEEEGEEDFNNNEPDVIKREDPKSPEKTTEGAGVNNDTEIAARNIEGMTSTDELEESVTENLRNNKEASEPNNEPVSILPDNGGQTSVEDGIDVVAKKVNQPRRKTTRTKLVRKKGTTPEMQPSDEIDGSPKGGATNEANPQSSVGKAALGEACREDETELVKNEGKSEVGNLVKVNRKLKKLRKKVLQGDSCVVAPGNENNPKATDEEPEIKENNQTVEQDTKNKGGENPEDRAIISKRKRKRKKVAKEGAQKVNANDVDKPGSSKKGNLSKRMDSMGMIFMCNSQTKKDCYQYKVLGLPAAKKELVSKIYKGMRLFLFDLELKMLYGIYKAAAPGGYDIEPRAFKSKFPAQVRFIVMEDCLPLAEENFKSVIKDNYYTKNKFNCELTNEQVKNLCKLFKETTKKAGAKLGAGVRRPVTSTPAQRDRKRKRVEDNPRAVPVRVTSSEHKRSKRRAREEVRRGAREEVRRAPQVAERSQRRVKEEVRRAPIVTERSTRRPQKELLRVPLATDDRYLQPAIVYDRETFLPSVASASLYKPRLAEDPPYTRPLYQPLRAEDPHTRALYQPLRIEDSPHTRAYAYERPTEIDTYRRDYRDPTYPSSQELRYTVERGHADPYVPYSQPSIYREPEYRADNGRGQYDYTSSVRYDEEYRSTENRAPLPLYRRY